LSALPLSVLAAVLIALPARSVAVAEGVQTIEPVVAAVVPAPDWVPRVTVIALALRTIVDAVPLAPKVRLALT
jgi:branched-subunit amino acid transport protein AzlD